MRSPFVKQFVDSGLGNASYLIASEETGLAAIIDAQRDVDQYLRAAEGLGLRVAYALDTHLHADFVSGALELAHQLGGAGPFQIGASSQAGLAYPHLPLSNGARLSLGDLSIEVLATPGHTPEHVGFAVYGPGALTPAALFSGGSLLVGGAGRSDLLGHEHALPLAVAQYHTLHDRLLQLPDEVVVYPTHGAGSFCVAGADEERVTTIGRERRLNPLAQLASAEAFARQALAGLPSYPAYYRYMRAVNQQGGRVLGGLPSLALLTPEAVCREIAAGAVVIDVRPSAEIIRGHIPGAFGIPLATPLITWAGWVVPFGSPLVLVADTAEEREAAVRQLIRIGYDDLRGYLEGGLAAWQQAGQPMTRWQPLDAEALRDWLTHKDTPVVLDVRSDREWREGHLPGAEHMEAGALPRLSGGFWPHDRPLVVHCAHGNRSTVALSILEQKQMRNLHVLEGGLASWLEAGYAIFGGDGA